MCDESDNFHGDDFVVGAVVVVKHERGNCRQLDPHLHHRGCLLISRSVEQTTQRLVLSVLSADIMCADTVLTTQSYSIKLCN